MQKCCFNQTKKYLFHLICNKSWINSIIYILTATNHHVAKRETCLRLYGLTNNCNNHGVCASSKIPGREHVLCVCDRMLWQGGHCEYYMNGKKKAKTEAQCSRLDCPSLLSLTCNFTMHFVVVVVFVVVVAVRYSSCAKELFFFFSWLDGATPRRSVIYHISLEWETIGW